MDRLARLMRGRHSIALWRTTTTPFVQLLVGLYTMHADTPRPISALHGASSTGKHRAVGARPRGRANPMRRQCQCARAKAAGSAAKRCRFPSFAPRQHRAKAEGRGKKPGEGNRGRSVRARRACHCFFGTGRGASFALAAGEKSVLFACKAKAARIGRRFPSVFLRSLHGRLVEGNQAELPRGSNAGRGNGSTR